MVRNCKEKYENEEFDVHFEKYPFALSDFQKYAIEAIASKNDILITAHTGSGKTLPAEFAIEHLVGLGKKVIYTSPIKALSNQKFYEMSKKFPHISFGILTGDIKFNPEADVLIMTTEILRNTFLFKQTPTDSPAISSLLQFDMDIENDLGAVVFDEVHYINDPSRGKVWEETIMLLPPHIQLVMLSATIDNPELFATWVENKSGNKKTMYLATTDHRVVPLVHYAYTCISNGIEKIMQDKHKSLYGELKTFINKPVLVKNAETSYDTNVIKHMRKLKTFLYNNKQRVSPKYALNQLVLHLNRNNMLPAICFVFSRKMVESYANSIETCLHEEGSTIPSTIHQECRMILQRRIPNYKEYLNLPEFITITKLLEKGVAIHHSGILPILREMTEMLFSKGYIKLLFATETFAVGLNMPTKTVIMSSFSKFNGNSMQYLHPHEYTQMAGRAGRRGIDTIGHVIHTNNLFDIPQDNEYSNILNGSPLPLVSKYDTSDNTILTMIHSGVATVEDISSLSASSLSSVEIANEKCAILKQLNERDVLYQKQMASDQYSDMENHMENISDYNTLSKSLASLRPNQYRKATMKIEKMFSQNPKLHEMINFNNELIETKGNIAKLNSHIEHLSSYYTHILSNRIEFLTKNGFINEEEHTITEAGDVARLLQEVPGLLFGKLLVETNFLELLSSVDCVILFSMINNVRVKDEFKRNNHYHIENSETSHVCSVINKLILINDNILSSATYHGIVPYEEELNYDIMEHMIEWVNVETEEDCHRIIHKMTQVGEIFLGEFIKTIIKINNICEEMKKVAEYFQKVEFLNKLSKISGLILKFVATNQSLYV